MVDDLFYSYFPQLCTCTYIAGKIENGVLFSTVSALLSENFRNIVILAAKTLSATHCVEEIAFIITRILLTFNISMQSSMEVDAEFIAKVDFTLENKLKSHIIWTRSAHLKDRH